MYLLLTKSVLPRFPPLFSADLTFPVKENSVLSPWNGKDLDALLRLLSSLLMSRCADLGYRGLCFGPQEGSLQPSHAMQAPHAVSLCSRLVVQTAHGCMGALGFLREPPGRKLWPIHLLSKVLHTANPELIWASTTPGEESAVSCKTQNWVFFRFAARLGQCRALQAVCPWWLRAGGVCWPAFLQPSCWWLHAVTLLPEPPHPHAALGWLPRGGHWACAPKWGISQCPSQQILV